MNEYKLINNMILASFMTWFTYLYIRKFLNPDNKYNVDKYRNDAKYGALAACVSTCLTLLIKDKFKVYF